MVDWKEFCGNCEKHGCCCGIEPVYITKKEEQIIRKATGIKNLTKNHLLRKENKKCIFLKKGFCGIQEIKPLDCRAWPVVFWTDAGHGKISYFLDLDCPVAMKLSNEDIDQMKKRIESELKDWSKEDLRRYDVCAYWKPEKLKKRLDKHAAYPFGKNI